MRLTLGTLALVALLTRTAAAEEQPKTASLGWVRLPGAESCITAQELAKRIEERVGRAVFVSAASSEIAIEGRIERLADRWRATVVATGEAGAKLGARELDSKESSCRALDEALVLVIAVTIDPDAEAKPPEPTTAPPPPPQPAPPPVTIVKTETIVRRVPFAVAEPSPWSADIRLAGLAALGVLPELAPGMRLSVGVGHAKFVPIDVSLGTLGSAGDRSGKGTTLSQYFAAIGVCPRKALTERWLFDACGVFQLATVRASGYGFDVSFERTRILPAAAVRARLALRLAGPYFASVGLEAGVPIVRARFLYTRADGSEAVLYAQPRAYAMAEIGIGVRFP